MQLAEREEVVKFDPSLGWREQEERMVYLLPPVAKWLECTLPELTSNWNLEQSPIEQLDDLVWQFCSGQELIVDRQFRLLRHHENGVWELKTADLRLFGWFHVRDCFVCAAANTALNVKNHGLYAGYVQQTVFLRDRLDLDEPKFIAGEDYDEIVTAWSYPPS